jgi:hypothetical protein
MNNQNVKININTKLTSIAKYLYIIIYLYINNRTPNFLPKWRIPFLEIGKVFAKIEDSVPKWT